MEIKTVLLSLERTPDLAIAYFLLVAKGNYFQNYTRWETLSSLSPRFWVIAKYGAGNKIPWEKCREQLRGIRSDFSEAERNTKKTNYELHNETDAMGGGCEEEMVSSLIMKYKLSDARTQGRTWTDRQKTEVWKTVKKLTIRLLETDTE